MDRRRLGKLWAFIAAMLFVVGLFPMHAFADDKNTPDTGSHTARIVWNDANDQDGFRPEKISVELFADDECIEGATLSDVNNWSYTWDMLPLQSSGVPILYHVGEDKVRGQLPSGYSVAFSADDDVTDITFTHVPETTDFKLRVVWAGDEGKDSRPDSLRVNLLANGSAVHSVLLRPGNDWSSILPGMDVRSDGQLIDYQWAEVGVTHYTMTSKTADGAATTMTYTYSSPMTLHFTSVDGEVMDAITFDVLAPDSTTIAQAINDHFNTTDGISYKPFVAAGYEDSNYRVTKPLTEYAGFSELNRDDILGSTYVGDGVEMYYVMYKVLSDTPEMTIEAPTCGTETTTPLDPASMDYDRNRQSNPPQVTCPDGSAYHPSDADGNLPGWWVKSADDRDPFIGTFKGGEAFYARLWLATDFGYVFPDDTFTVHGGELVSVFDLHLPHRLFISGVVKVTAVHDAGDPVNDGFVAADCTTDGTHDVIVRCKQCDEVLSTDTVVDEPKLGHQWGDWKVTKRPTTTSAGEEVRECTRCDEKETRVVEPIPVEKGTLTFDLAGGTLDGKTGKVTIEANVGDTIKLPGAPKREGYTFKCWKGSEYAAGAQYKVEGDHTFTAEWEKNAATTGSSSLPKTSDPSVPVGTIVSIGIVGVALAATGYALRRRS